MYLSKGTPRCRVPVPAAQAPEVPRVVPFRPCAGVRSRRWGEPSTRREGPSTRGGFPSRRPRRLRCLDCGSKFRRARVPAANGRAPTRGESAMRGLKGVGRDQARLSAARGASMAGAGRKGGRNRWRRSTQAGPAAGHGLSAFHQDDSRFPFEVGVGRDEVRADATSRRVDQAVAEAHALTPLGT